MITVLMPVYNGSPYLPDAIESILAQTFFNFELVAIDDASTDRSAAILAAYGEKDGRIRFFRNDENQGLIATLNRGLDLARGEYVARMDQDDVSLPQRLERQIAFMENHPDVGVCGTWVRTMGERDETWAYPSGSDEIKCSFVFESVLAHPSAMLRRSHFGAGGFRYDEGFSHAEDYALWARCAKVMEFANIPEVLVEYRIHADQTVRRQMRGKVMSADRVREIQLRSLGIIPSTSEMDLHRDISTCRFRSSLEFVELAGKWLQRLACANDATSSFPEHAFSKVLARRWFLVCRAASGTGIRAWRAFRSSPLYNALGQSAKEQVVFAAKCGLKRGH